MECFCAHVEVHMEKEAGEEEGDLVQETKPLSAQTFMDQERKTS